jgi:hypothetical protein
MNEKINLQTYWQWLNEFIFILENLVSEAEEMNTKTELTQMVSPKLFAELRISERTLNFFIDQFMLKLLKNESLSFSEFFSTVVGVGGEENPTNLWSDIKEKRDDLADRISKLIEDDPKNIARYQDYCERLKNQRNIGAAL